MKKALLLVCAVLALGIVAVGCGDDDDGDSGAGTTTEQTTTEQATTTDETETEGGGAAGGGGGAESVDIVDIDFDPREITVPAGTTVTWTNTGDLPHTVTKDSGPGEDFDSGSLSSGDTFEQTFTEPGTYDYLCTIHANQNGTVIVE